MTASQQPAYRSGPVVAVEVLPLFEARYHTGKMIARMLGVAGWLLIPAGIAVAILSAVIPNTPAWLAGAGTFGLPAGSALGMATAASGLALVLFAQLALAVFDGSNAARLLLAIERSNHQA